MHDHAHEHSHHHSHEHSHATLHGIEHIVRDHLDIPDNVKQDILAVYGLIAEAESQVHGVPVTQVHFHEVGAMDAVADITAVCLLLDVISPDRIAASPVHVGSGTVHCAHGILPVPAPATALLLRDIPIYSGDVQGELCTPTGAALLRHFVHTFGEMPVMRMQCVGYGMGQKDFQQANCVRAMLGNTDEKAGDVIELQCNLDDMTAEEIGFAAEILLRAGALDVYTVPIGMKKSRPGTMLCVLCEPAQKESMVKELFRHTTTIGIREMMMPRYTLERHIETVQTPFGSVRRKTAEGYGITRCKWEYNDLAQIAKEQDITLAQARSEAESAE